ncbi:MAG: diguanylate cyclase [Pseudonocardiaceae bacterium]|nr:diguanylate cyclase [Pseudonocardiaceae bacterium]
MDGTAPEDVRIGIAAGGGDAAALVESALALRWRAPELALLAAERAGASAADTGDAAAAHTAELVAVASLNRLGREVEAAQRALPALRRCEQAGVGGDVAGQLRAELAAGAVAAGMHTAALAALRPVLEAGGAIGPAVRGSALVQAAAALAALERPDDAAGALNEADDLYRGDPDLEAAHSVLLRGTVRAARSGRHRRLGDARSAELAARDGLDLLAGLGDPAPDGGGVGGRLVLELALALLDRGDPEAAMRGAAALLDTPVRPAAAAPTGWLRLAVALRVHLPCGQQREALNLLADAVDAAERHSLDPVLAECLDGLSRVHEARGEHAEALRCLRSAHAAGYRSTRAADAARVALAEEFANVRGEITDLAGHVAGLLSTTRTRRRRGGTEPAGVLDGRAFAERVEVVLAATHAGRAMSMAVVAVDQVHGSGGSASQPEGDGAVAELVEQVRAAAPVRGLVGRLESGELAVLLPGAGHAAAQDWAQRLRNAVAGTDRSEVADGGVTISTGVAEHSDGGGADELLTAARGALADGSRPGPIVEPDEDSDAELTPSGFPTVELPDQQAGIGEQAYTGEPVPDVEETVPDVEETVPDIEETEPDVEHLVPAEDATPDDSAEPAAEPPGRGRHSREGADQLPVAELLSAAGITGRSRPGRRRAEDRTDDHPNGNTGAGPSDDPAPTTDPNGETSVAPSAPVSPDAGPPSAPEPPWGSERPWGSEPPLGSEEVAGWPAREYRAADEPGSALHGEGHPGLADPPPAPALRAFEWSSAAEATDVGLGDLLAEALAAFQEGRSRGAGGQVWDPPDRDRRSAAGD